MYVLMYVYIYLHVKMLQLLVLKFLYFLWFVKIHIRRDYRWYAEDMVHPTPLARKFILGKFSSKYLTEEAQSLATRIDSINRNMNHVPFFPQTEAYRKHLSSTIASMQDIMQHNNTTTNKQKRNIGNNNRIDNDFSIDFSEEIHLLQCKLKSLQQ